MDTKTGRRITESDIIMDAESIRAAWLICELLAQEKSYPHIHAELRSRLGISINLNGQGDIAYLRMVATVPEEERIDCKGLSESQIADHANCLRQEQGLSWGQIGARMGVREERIKKFVEKHYGKGALTPLSRR